MEIRLLGVLCFYTFLSVAPLALVSSRDIIEIIGTRKELSEFYELVQTSEIVKTMLRYAEITVFAPNNEAFRKYKGSVPKSANLLAYHLVKSSVTSDRFPAVLPSELAGSLPIWVSKQDYQYGGFTPKPTYYANNGEIVQMDIKGQAIDGASQVLHIIDEVLEPTLPQNDDPNYRNPSAHRILSNPNVYGVVEQFTSFEQRVNNFRKSMIFQGGEGQTFFLPVEGNTNVDAWNKVDDKVIDGHVIPNKVYFTKSFPLEPQETLSFNDNIKVVITMKNESINDGRDFELSVQSNTVVGYPQYPKGTVVAKIVKANIPVRNGVVHLIENPLIIINKNVLQILQQNYQLRAFYDVLQEHNRDLLERLMQYHITLFAPSNEAFQRVDSSRLNMVYGNENSVKQMLNLHAVPQLLSTEEIIRSVSVVPTMDQTRKLHFRHTHHNVTVVGGGVNATITTPDVGAINGLVHVIDKVMGIPYRTIYEKLSQDPSLSETFELGNQQGYNEKFRQFDRVFTYFVPHNDAWFNLRQRYPSEYDKLKSGQYTYHVQKILNRHLVINNQYSLQELLRLPQPFRMVDGLLDFFESNGRYYVRWDGETSEILDADVDTNNGKVHVLRDVLFKQSDVTTGRAPTTTPLLSLLTLTFTAILARYIL